MIADACADFETTTDPEDCRVWGWGIAYTEYPDTVEIDHTIDQFIERISEENLRIYFHNLKFDGMFILFWLLTNDYEHITDNTKPRPGQFKTLISKMGQFYSIEVGWKSGYHTQFRDSLKKLNMPVADVAKTFNLPMSKGDIDYHAKRPVGYMMSADERDYLHRDVSIMAHAMKQTLDSGMKKLTTGSDALHEYKQIMGKQFLRLFPVMSDSMDSEIRRAYRGGFTYADERFKGRHLREPGIVLDVNSLYPHVMYSKSLPYGEPKFFDGKPPEGDDSRPLTVFSVTFTAKLKPDHVPCIQVKSNFMFSPTEYVEEITTPVTLMVTSIDWALYSDHYDIDVLEWGGGWAFKARTGMFREYIDKWSKVKEESEGGARALAKLFLNSLYGKLATNPHIASKAPTLVGGKVKLVNLPDDVRDPIYIPGGVFITSWARELTIRAAQANYARFAYADTDSLHLMGLDIPEGLEVDPTKMGAWALEYEFSEAFYICPKAYLERIQGGKKDGQIEVHIAGLPARVADSLTFEDIYDGHILKGKLVPKSVPGGVVLADIDYELKVR